MGNDDKLSAVNTEKNDKKEHILNVAEHIFAEVGFHGATTRAISRKAGVNMAMLNYYFGSKEGMYLAVFDRKIASLENTLSTINKNDLLNSWEKVARYIENYCDGILYQDTFQKLLYREVGAIENNKVSAKIRKMLLNSISELKSLLQTGINNGEFKPDTNVPLVIACLFGTKNYILNYPLMSNEVLEYDILDEEVLQTRFKPELKSFLINSFRSILLKSTALD